MLSEKSYLPRVEIKLLVEFLEKCVVETESKLKLGIKKDDIYSSLIMIDRKLFGAVLNQFDGFTNMFKITGELKNLLMQVNKNIK